MTRTRIDIKDLINPHLKHFTPYASARETIELDNAILLDANENPVSGLPEIDYNRYPDPRQKALRAKIAERKGLNTEQVFTGTGSDEAIDLIFRLFCYPGKDKVVWTPPTFGMYKVGAGVMDLQMIDWTLNDQYHLDMERWEEIKNAGAKILWLTSPNNPTGNAMKREDLLRCIDEFPGIVVADQAYIEYHPEGDVLPLLEEHPNLIVLNTFSKAWGLAGLRLGMAFASAEIIHWLLSIKLSYNLNSQVQESVIEALTKHKDRMEAQVARTLEEKAKLKNELEQVPTVQKIYPSDANFFLVKVEDAPDFYEYLIEQNIVVRSQHKNPKCANTVRITVGSEEENAALIKAMKGYSV